MGWVERQECAKAVAEAAAVLDKAVIAAGTMGIEVEVSQSSDVYLDNRIVVRIVETLAHYKNGNIRTIPLGLVNPGGV